MRGMMTTMNTKNDDEMAIMVKTVNDIRSYNYPQIPEELVNTILMIEKKYINDREKAYDYVKDLIERKLQTF